MSALFNATNNPLSIREHTMGGPGMRADLSPRFLQSSLHSTHMSVLDQRIRRYTEQLTALLIDLVSKDTGIPRPIISLTNDMPFPLPVQQRAVVALKRLVEEMKAEFSQPTLSFHINPFDEPGNRRSIQVPFPYIPLTQGDVIDTLKDGSEIRLISLVVTNVPANWKSPRALDLLIQARAPSRRYGEALATAPRINLRVPRFAIAGKETGI